MPGYAMAIRTARMVVVRDAIDAGTGPGFLKFYNDPRPATGAALTTQTLLATTTFSDPCGTPANAVLTFSAIAQDISADADGKATWARSTDSTGAFVADFSVGLAGSGAEIILNNVNLVAGGPVSITSGSITEGCP